MREQDLPVLQVYAEALGEAAHQAEQYDETFDEAQGLGEVLGQHPALLLFLDKPAIEKEDKKRLLRNVFTDQLSPLMLQLGLLLVDKNRGGLWLEVLREFIRQAERARGIFEARVATAHELDDEERRGLRECLEAFTGKQLRIQFDQEPDLLGGVRFRYGDVLVDGSLRGRLREIRDRLEAIRID